LGTLSVALSGLRRTPELFLFIQAQGLEPRRLLDRSKAAFELSVGLTESFFRVDLQMACEVRDREEQVAELLVLGVGLALAVKFLKLLIDLGSRPRGIRPIEPRPSGALLQFHRAIQRWKGRRHSVERAVLVLFLPFHRLDRVPTRGFPRIAEYVRVPALQLVANAPDDVIQGEVAQLLRHLRVEDDLELEIAELILEIVHVATVDGVGHLISFFDRVGRDRGERLLPIPFATELRIAKPVHDRDQTAKTAHEGIPRGLFAS